MLHLVTAATVLVILLGGLPARDRLSFWIPDFDNIRDSIRAGLFSSLLTFAFIRSTQTNDNDLIDIAKTQKKRIGPELIGYARDLAERKGLDPDLVEAVILTESIQRPRWFHRLEFMKGAVFRKGTLGHSRLKKPSSNGRETGSSISSDQTQEHFFGDSIAIGIVIHDWDFEVVLPSAQ